MPMHRRRVRNSGGMCAFASQSAQKYIQHTVQQWLYATMSCGAAMDNPFFACLGAVNNGLQGKARSLGSYLGNNCVRGLGERKKEALRKEIRNTSVKRYPSLFAGIWEDYPSLHTDFQEILFPESSLKYLAVPRDIQKARATLAEHLGCSEEMLTFLEFVYILRTNEPVEGYFEDSISVHKRSTLPVLAKMLSLPERVLHRVIMEAYACGFMRDSAGDFFHMSSLVEKLWNADIDTDIDDIIYVKNNIY